MTLRIQLSRTSDLTAADHDRLQRLTRAVYPRPHAGTPREWASGEFCVLGLNAQEDLVSYLRICRATANLDTRPIRLGGIGGVKTHPDHRGKGYASDCIAIAVAKLREIADVGLLVCRDELIGFYESRGWRQFQGDFIVSQYGEREVFTYNHVMVCDLKRIAPTQGEIELPGPPW